MKISVVVVLYKKEFNESIAIKSLLSYFDQASPSYGNEVELFVWNNSPEYSKKLENERVHWLEGNNTPLPKVYNEVAKKAFALSSDFLLISDDDTDFKGLDLSALVNIPFTHSFCGIAVPKVYENDRLVSPGRRILFKGRRLANISNGLVNSSNFVGINSGLIISKCCYEIMNPLFDENLKFYGTDTDFFVRYEKKFPYAYVMNFKIEHSLSESSNESLDRSLFRWSDHFYATRHTFRDAPFYEKNLLRVYIHYMRVKLSIKYRSFQFMKI